MGLRALRRVLVVVALLALGVTGEASAITFSHDTPVTYGGVNMCTGEAFMGTGTVHFLMNDSLSANGMITHDLNVRFDGLQAFTPTGKKYVVQDVFYDHFVFTSADEETTDITAHFIRVGEDGSFVLGDDFYEYMRTHITANANGQITALTVSTNDMPCQ
jgi:hypothetical protein